MSFLNSFQEAYSKKEPLAAALFFEVIIDLAIKLINE
jgi:hypothetical protein